MLRYNPKLKSLARGLRTTMTEAERALWSRIRGKQLLGVQFYRHKPIENFIVDFYAPAAKLVIELDGGQHFEEEHQQQDKIRDQFLAQRDLYSVRFTNREVLLQMDAVLEQIYCVLKERLSNPPQPPFYKGGS